jgi:hypothetical protein
MSDLDIVWSRPTAPDIARQIIDAAKKKAAHREAARKRAEARREQKQIASRPENGQPQIKGRNQ